MLYTAFCYLPYTFLLMLFILYLPALALSPRLIAQPRLAAGIPIFSIAIISAIAFILFEMGWYSHSIITTITLVIGIIAIIRLGLHRKKLFTEWGRDQRALLLINISMILPLIAISGLSAFIVDDALVSWNYWATHYYLDQNAAIISGGYPQAFSILLSYCYKFLDSLQYQGPVKAMLVILPLTLLNLLAFNNKNIKHYIWIYFIIAIICVFPGFLNFGFYRFYSFGYADPLLAAALLTSAQMLCLYCESEDNDENKNDYLWLSVISAMLASLSKQPGFFWVLWGFPLIILSKAYKKKKRKLSWQEIIAIVAVIIPVGIWLTGNGSHFYHNQGVISTSTGSAIISASILLKTFFGSVLNYFIKQPSLLIIYILAGIAAYQDINKKILYLGFILPSTVLWFIFGAYNIRLGLHLLVLCAWLILSSEFLQQFFYFNKLNILYRLRNWIIILSLVFFGFFSIREQVVQHHGVQDNIFPLNSPKTVIAYNFSTGAPFIYEQVFNHSHISLWIPTQYIWAIFYGYNKIIMPSDNANLAALSQQLLATKPEYIFTSGKIPSPITGQLSILIKKCPESFIEIPLGTPYYAYQFYRFLPSECLKKIK